MQKKQVGFLFTILFLIIAGAGYWIYNQQTKIEQMSEEFNLVKEDLTDDYSQLVLQYEGYDLKTDNDSLLKLYEEEKIKVQRLRDELTTVKASDVKRIRQLKNELKTVRKVLKSYIAQVDSLNKVNSKLVAENKKVKRRYREISRTANKLSKEKEQLKERVTLASQLNATNIQLLAVNKRGKKERKISKVKQLNISFTIARNITTDPGDKTIYIVIMKPNDEILTKKENHLFKYEDKEIPYSIRKDIEFTGEEKTNTVYWKVEEFLNPGTYQVAIFVDGNQIGLKSFILKKK